MTECHRIPPIFDCHAEIMILGSFPSVKSREAGFYYAHPQNRFWRVLARVFAADTPEAVGEKIAFLTKNRIALWDVLASCEITGSADSAIRSPVANDLSRILSVSPIRAVYTNGKTADALYRRFGGCGSGRDAICLPSTSPANAAYSLDALTEAWSVIRKEQGL